MMHCYYLSSVPKCPTSCPSRRILHSSYVCTHAGVGLRLDRPESIFSIPRVIDSSTSPLSRLVLDCDVDK